MPSSAQYEGKPFWAALFLDHCSLSQIQMRSTP